MNTKLCLVFAIRHAVYDETGPCPEREEQITALIRAFKALVPSGKKVVFLYSPTTRALYTARDISDEYFGLEIEPTECGELYDDKWSDGKSQMEAILKLVGDATIVVAVTHQDAPSGIMNAFSESFGGQAFPKQTSANGTGFFIDLETKTVTPIP